MRSFPCGQGLTCQEYRNVDNQECHGTIHFDENEKKYYIESEEERECPVVITLNYDNQQLELNEIRNNLLKKIEEHLFEESLK